MKEKNVSREVFINDAIYEFRGGMAREFYFTNEDYPSIPYYYDPMDDCLHADEVSVPFHFKEDDITYAVILKSLEALNDAVIDYFEKNKGITLYEYD